MKKSIITENEYRTQIYEYLNRTLECYLVHGTNEHGVDILVKRNDIFNEPRYVGISVKVGNITCKELSIIVRQLIISCYYKYSYFEHNLDAVYIVTNGRIIPEARNQISSINIPYRNIYFIEGTKADKFLNVLNAKYSGEKPKTHE